MDAIIGVMRVQLQRLDPDLPVPRRAHRGDGGADLCARAGVRLAPRERALVGTGLAVAVPEGYCALVTPRSGLAVRHGIGVANGPGIIDSGYRGEVMVILVNHGAEHVDIARGDRIAQLVVVPIPDWEFEEVAELPDSERGSGGFGSTGV